MNQNGFSLDARRVQRGVWVFGAGALLSMVGLTMTSRELAAATRRYIQQMDVPPNQLARQGLSRARVAATAGAAAGADAWRQSNNGSSGSTQSIDLNPRTSVGATAGD
jgi:GH24 family phage-related lysozyme (muramidase)